MNDRRSRFDRLSADGVVPVLDGTRRRTTGRMRFRREKEVFRRKPARWRNESSLRLQEGHRDRCREEIPRLARRAGTFLNGTRTTDQFQKIRTVLLCGEIMPLAFAHPAAASDTTAAGTTVVLHAAGAARGTCFSLSNRNGRQAGDNQNNSQPEAWKKCGSHFDRYSTGLAADSAA